MAPITTPKQSVTHVIATHSIRAPLDKVGPPADEAEVEAETEGWLSSAAVGVGFGSPVV